MENRESPIPIKNLFYMLCYAWNVLSIKDNIKVDTENCKDIYSFLSKIFAFGVGQIIRSGFYKSYISVTEELPTVKGKILIQSSIDQLSFQRRRLVCKYDEHSEDILFNQIVKYTIESMLNNGSVDWSVKKQLKSQSAFFEGIQSKPPLKTNLKKLIYNRNNITYKLLLNIAVMLYNNTVPNEENGKNSFKDFFRQKRLMNKVFEDFIFNFYAWHLDKNLYHVHRPRINWPIEEETTEIWFNAFDVNTNPGDRRTDIVIDYCEKLQMIFDAKYYVDTFVKAYMGEEETRIRVGHLNQLRGYVIDSAFQGKKIGALLYPMVNHDLQRGMIYPIVDSPIIIKTINLNEDWQLIENDMLDFVKRIVDVQKQTA